MTPFEPAQALRAGIGSADRLAPDGTAPYLPGESPEHAMAIRAARELRPLAAALLLLLAGAHPLPAQSTPDRTGRIDLQLMEQRLRGLSRIEQQQRLREDDRKAASVPLGRLEIPVMRPGCPPGAGGSRLSTAC